MMPPGTRDAGDRVGRLVDDLGLKAHPEGGFYRELYRSPALVTPADGRPPRVAVTTIYFLLAAGDHSRWHRVASDEIWHFYEGDPLELLAADPAVERVERVVIGPGAAGHPRVHVVPAGWWQAARPLGAYALTGCTVAPGFTFDDFAFLRDDPEAMTRLKSLAEPFGALL